LEFIYNASIFKSVAELRGGTIKEKNIGNGKNEWLRDRRVVLGYESYSGIVRTRYCIDII